MLLLTLAGIGDLFEEVRDPMRMVSTAYQTMYGFIPNNYTRQNFSQAVWRSLKTGDIERVIKGNSQYLRLTGSGKDRLQRDFPLLGFSRKWNKKWVILIFDIEEKSRKLRNLLRNKLKNIGFGMLQKSTWITPLPIAREMMDFINSNNLEKHVFVLEVSGILLGNPKKLAKKVWGLDKIEEKQIYLEQKKKEIDASFETLDDRLKNRKEEKRKEINKQQLELALSLPFMFDELLPNKLKELL